MPTHRANEGSLCCLARPRAAGVAVALGVTVGFAAGENLTACLLLVAALVLRLPLAAFGAAVLCGVAAGWLATPVSFVLGRWILDDSGCGAALQAVLGRTVLAILGWDHDTVVGGLALGLPVAAACALAVAEFQRRLAARPLILAATWPPTLLTRPSRAARALAWLVGARVVPVAVAAQSLGGPRRVWRRRWYAWSAGGATFVVLTAAALVDRVQEQTLCDQLGALVGAPVAIDDWRASGERLDITGLRIFDPRAQGSEVVRIEQLSATLAAGTSLDDGRLHIERALIRDLRLAPVGLPAPGMLPHLAGGVDEAAGSGGTIELPLQHGFAGGAAAVERLRTGWQALSLVQSRLGREAAPPAQRLTARSPRAALRQARMTRGRPAPRLTIDYLQIEELPVCWNLGRGAIVKVLEFDTRHDAPQAGPLLELTAPELTLAISARLQRNPQARSSVKVRFFDALATDWLTGLASSRWHISAGTVQAEAQGWFDARGFELDGRATARGLRAQLAGEMPVAGLAPATWNRCLARLGEIHVPVRVAGNWHDAHLKVESAALIDALAVAMRAAGDEETALAVVAEYRGQRPAAVAAAPPARPAPVALPEVAETAPVAETSPSNVAAAPPIPTPHATAAPADAAPVDTRYTPAPVADRYANVAPAPVADRYAHAAPRYEPAEDRYAEVMPEPAPAAAAVAPAAPEPVEAPAAPSTELATAPQAPAVPAAPVLVPEERNPPALAEGPRVDAPAPAVDGATPAVDASVPAEDDSLLNPLRRTAPGGAPPRRRMLAPPPAAVPAAPTVESWRAGAPERPVAPSRTGHSSDGQGQWTGISPSTDGSARPYLIAARPADPGPAVVEAPPAGEPTGTASPAAVAGVDARPEVDPATLAPEPIDMELGYDENFPTAAAGARPGGAGPAIVPESFVPPTVATPGTVVPSGARPAYPPASSAAPASTDVASPAGDATPGIWQRVRSIFRRKPAEPPAVNPFEDPERVAEREEIEPAKPRAGGFFRR